jgi:uncharacterized MnhB-related membrane protein
MSDHNKARRYFRYSIEFKLIAFLTSLASILLFISGYLYPALVGIGIGILVFVISYLYFRLFKKHLRE